MKTYGIAALVAGFLATSAAHATSIHVSVFDIADWTSETSFGTFIVEDFETTGPDVGAGQLAGPLPTAVGSFGAIGGSGSGGTCAGNNPGATCTFLALEQNDNPFSQGNLVPDTGEWSLNSNDTDGILWKVFTGSLFNKIVFASKDAADIGNIFFTVETGDATASFGPGAGDGNEKLIVIKFGSAQMHAEVSMFNSASKPDDSFSFDGAAVNVVPVPAAGLLLLGGLGALAAVRRRQRGV
jgi:hypothetical protein